jgi:hypothetical protein
MERHEHTPEELAALELYHQLVNLSPDQGKPAVLVTLRLPSGRYVGDVWLTVPDVNDLSDACVGLAAVRDYEHANPLTAPDALPEVDTADVTQMVTALENLANGGQL